jgi:hypothetical protein
MDQMRITFWSGELKERPFGRSRIGWEDIVRTDLRLIRRDGLDWLHVAQGGANGGML